MSNLPVLCKKLICIQIYASTNRLPLTRLTNYFRTRHSRQRWLPGPCHTSANDLGLHVSRHISFFHFQHLSMCSGSKTYSKVNSWFQNFKRNYYWCLRSKPLADSSPPPTPPRLIDSNIPFTCDPGSLNTQQHCTLLSVYCGRRLRLCFIYSRELEPTHQDLKRVEYSYGPSGPSTLSKRIL